MSLVTRIFRNWVVGLPLLFAMTVSSYAIDLTEVARFNIDSTADAANAEFIGNNPTAVAWSGSRLYVGGFNNSGGFGDTGIVELLDANASGIVDTPAFSPVDTFFTPASRGVASMDFSADGASLAVAFDDGAPIVPTPNGFSVYDTSSNTRRWGADVRGSSGAAFDPGFMGVGAGTGFGAFGSGRVQLYDTTTGVNLADATNGDIWFDGVGGVGFTRDIDFDPVTGDIYARHSNKVSRAIRTGADSTNPQGVISSVTPADFVGIQNLSFLRYPDGGSEASAVIFNNRENAAGGQLFSDSVRVIDTDGNALTPNFSFLDGLFPADGSGSYDFDYDFATNTLAVVDFGNRNVHIFEVGSGVTGPNCDINGDTFCDTVDLRLLYDDIALAVSGGPADLDGSGTVDNDDIDDWLVSAGTQNGLTYLPGDTDLNGAVGGGDFTALASNFGGAGLPGAYWDQGNFDGNAGGTFSVGGGDFTALASNFGASSLAAVPEGNTSLWLMPLLLAFIAVRRSR